MFQLSAAQVGRSNAKITLGGYSGPGLAFGKQREAAVDGRIPQRQLTFAEGAGEKVAERMVLHHHVLHEKRPFQRSGRPEENGNRRPEQPHRP